MGLDPHPRILGQFKTVQVEFDTVQYNSICDQEAGPEQVEFGTVQFHLWQEAGSVQEVRTLHNPK